MFAFWQSLNWVAKSQIAYRAQSYTEALEAATRAAEIRPNNYHAWIAKGLALGEFNRWDEAAEAFARARSIKPTRG